MKKLLLICISLMLCATTYGWSVREHATVAEIAERHLTPKAKKLVTKYLGGRPMAYYASHADFFRNEMIVDIGYEAERGKRYVVFPHTYHVDEQHKPYRDIVKSNGKVFGNMLYHIDRLAKGLKEGHREMNDSVRLTHLYLIIHGVGDMHCPMHMRFTDHYSLGTYKVYFGKKKLSHHQLWDSHIISSVHPWSYEDMATLFDIYDKREREDFCKGGLFEWGEDVAKAAYPIHEYSEGAKINVIEYRRKYQHVGEQLLTKAGYRLAKMLNDILK